MTVTKTKTIVAGKLALKLQKARLIAGLFAFWLMFDTKKAAQYFVVAWCKNWTCLDYLRAVAEDTLLDDERLAAAMAAFPWVCQDKYRLFAGRPVRAHVVDNFPRLSEWLWTRANDAARLACAPQVEKLKDASVVKRIAHPPRRDKDYAQQMLNAGMRSKIAKSHNRSAWNVCKA